jgi:hypothetical protein
MGGPFTLATVNSDNNYVTIAKRKTNINFVHLKPYKDDLTRDTFEHTGTESMARFPLYRKNAEQQKMPRHRL